MIKRISVTETAQLIKNEEVIVVDIRDINSFNQGHIVNAIRLDNNNITNFLEQSDKSKAIIVCCYHGNSSQPAAEMLNQQGFEKSYSMDGGMTEWMLSQSVVAD